MSGAAWLAAALFLVPASGAPTAAPPVPEAASLELSLEKAIALGLENNLDINLAAERLAYLQALRRQAIGAGLPAVTLNGLYSRNIGKPTYFLGGQSIQAGSDNSMRADLSFQQYLFAGGMVAQGMKAARLGVEQGRFQLHASRQDVALAVKQLFYAVCLASETAAIQRDSLTLAEDHLRTIRERFRQGLDSDLVVLRQDVEVANSQPALLAARDQHELALTLLKDSLGLDVDAPVRVVGGLDRPRASLSAYEALQSAAVRNNPDYQAALARSEQAEALVKVEQAGRWPWLMAYADYQLYSESDAPWPRRNERADSSLLGLRLSYPLFTGGQTTAKIDEARSVRSQARTSLEKIARGIRVEVKRQWLAVHEARERAASQESAISQARRALEATETRYRAGEASLLEQNDATLALQQTRLLYANALHDYRAAAAALERAVGGPVEETSP